MRIRGSITYNGFHGFRSLAAASSIASRTSHGVVSRKALDLLDRCACSDSCGCILVL